MSVFVQPGQVVPDDHPYKHNIPVPAQPSAEEIELARIQELRNMHPPEAAPPLEPIYPKPRFNSQNVDSLRTSTHVGDIDKNLHLGDNVKYTEAFFNMHSGQIRLGDHVFLGQYTSLIAGSHDYTQTQIGRAHV